MAVQVATLDILTERAHLEPEVARAIGDAIEMEMNHGKTALATRAELFEVRDELKREISELRQEFSDSRDHTEREFVSVRSEMTQGFAAVRSEIAAVRAEMAQGFAAIRAEMKTEYALLRAEIQVAAANTKTEMMKFMFSALVGQTALILGIMYFMLRYLR